MKLINKRITILLVFAVLFAGTHLFADDQITKFAVVDTSRVYSSWFRESAAVRNYEAKQTEYQNEIQKRTNELKTLHDKQIDYIEKEDELSAIRLEAEITKKTDYLKEYTNAKTVELESLYKSLQDNDDFYKKLQNVLAKIAESGGYSMVINLQEYNAILWYSPSVDITEQVISALGLSGR